MTVDDHRLRLDNESDERKNEDTVAKGFCHGSTKQIVSIHQWYGTF